MLAIANRQQDERLQLMNEWMYEWQ